MYSLRRGGRRRHRPVRDGRAGVGWRWPGGHARRPASSLHLWRYSWRPWPYSTCGVSSTWAASDGAHPTRARRLPEADCTATGGLDAQRAPLRSFHPPPAHHLGPRFLPPARSSLGFTNRPVSGIILQGDRIPSVSFCVAALECGATHMRNAMLFRGWLSSGPVTRSIASPRAYMW